VFIGDFILKEALMWGFCVVFCKSVESRQNFGFEFLDSWSTIVPNFKPRFIMEKELWGFEVEVFGF